MSINQMSHLKFRTMSVCLQPSHQLCCPEELSPSPGPPSLPTMRNWLSILSVRLDPATNLFLLLLIYALFLSFLHVFYYYYFLSLSRLCSLLGTIPNWHSIQTPMYSSLVKRTLTITLCNYKSFVFVCSGERENNGKGGAMKKRKTKTKKMGGKEKQINNIDL